MVIGCLRLSDVNVICWVVNLHQTLPKIWGGFLYGVYRPVEWLELIAMVDMESRNPIEGYFGSEFPAVCNHCGVMAVWSCITFKKFAFFGKNDPYGKIFKTLFRTFSSQPIDVLCSNFMKFGWQEIGEIVHCLPDKNNLPGSNCH